MYFVQLYNVWLFYLSLYPPTFPNQTCRFASDDPKRRCMYVFTYVCMYVCMYAFADEHPEAAIAIHVELHQLVDRDVVWHPAERELLTSGRVYGKCIKNYNPEGSKLGYYVPEAFVMYVHYYFLSIYNLPKIELSNEKMLG
jgi:hypothetical protein